MPRSQHHRPSLDANGLARRMPLHVLPLLADTPWAQRLRGSVVCGGAARTTVRGAACMCMRACLCILPCIGERFLQYIVFYIVATVYDAGFRLGGGPVAFVRVRMRAAKHTLGGGAGSVWEGGAC